MPLAAPVLTNINDQSQIFFSESPIHFNFQNIDTDESIESVTVEVYIWRGRQSFDLPETPSIVFNNIKKISPHDDYIAIEIHNEVKAFITSSNLNKNNPQWAYNATGAQTLSGEGCYFHIVYKVDNEADMQLGTFFATLGYRYAYEQKGGYYQDYISEATTRRYAKGVIYQRNSLRLNTTVANSISNATASGSPAPLGMVSFQIIGPAVVKEQTGVPCIIAYLNRIGLWDVFTPFGKFVEMVPTKREDYGNSYRNPLNVNAQIQHMRQNSAPKGSRKFQINTGVLDETQNYQVQELLQSSKMYLVIFEKEVFTETSVGLTVDSTLVTSDDTTITVDSDTVTSEDIGFYSKFVQIPVSPTNRDFTRKTRLNDKSSISYTLELEEANNFINDIL